MFCPTRPFSRMSCASDLKPCKEVSGSLGSNRSSCQAYFGRVDWSAEVPALRAVAVFILHRFHSHSWRDLMSLKDRSGVQPDPNKVSFGSRFCAGKGILPRRVKGRFSSLGEYCFGSGLHQARVVPLWRTKRKEPTRTKESSLRSMPRSGPKRHTVRAATRRSSCPLALKPFEAHERSS